MSDKVLISVIVPVYNVEPYLKHCLASIAAQSYHNVTPLHRQTADASLFIKRTRAFGPQEILVRRLQKVISYCLLIVMTIFIRML